jgi:gas vesicle protein
MGKQDKSGSGFVGFLVGGALGLAVGLLIAPEQGEKLRRKVAYRVKHLAHDLEELVERFGKGEIMDEDALLQAKESTDEVNVQAKQLQDEMNALMDRHKRVKANPELLN